MAYRKIPIKVFMYFIEFLNLKFRNIFTSPQSLNYLAYTLILSYKDKITHNAMQASKIIIKDIHLLII